MTRQVLLYIPPELGEVLAAAKQDAKNQRQGLGWILLTAWRRDQEHKNAG